MSNSNAKTDMKEGYLRTVVNYCVVALFLLVAVGCNRDIRNARKAKFNTVQNIPPNIERWEKAIAAFEREDENNKPKKGSIVFVGSSSIVKWKGLSDRFPDEITLNRGFGGSQTDEVHYYAFRTIFPYKPKQVVIYVGDNDIASGKSPEVVFTDLKDLFEDIRYQLPKAKITFISIKPSPSRWKLMDKFVQTNSMVEQYLKSDPNASYVDIVNLMLMENGKPNPSYFLSDSLHMTAAGYEVWEKALRPHIR